MTYLKAGAHLSAANDEWRPTQEPDPDKDWIDEDGQGWRRDIRLTMVFPRTFGHGVKT